MTTFPPCELARSLIVQLQVTPESNHQPRGPITYFPDSLLHGALQANNLAMNVVRCRCSRCQAYSVQGMANQLTFEATRAELVGGYATVFSLLIYLRYPSLIGFFMSRGAKLTRGQQYFTKDALNFLEPRVSGLPRVEANIIIQEVLEHQYRFLLPEFNDKTIVSVFSEQQVLPIIEVQKPLGRGDYGEVYQFTIHEDCIGGSLKRLQVKQFARKVFYRWRSTDDIAKTGPTLKEWLNILYANELHHPHVMNSLFAFQHGPWLSIVSELGSTDLGRILAGEAKVGWERRELWSQVLGLAGGLAYLHGQRHVSGQPVQGDSTTLGEMFHQDLKPSNILIVRKTMKIADFGLSEFKPNPAPLQSASSSSGPLINESGVYRASPMVTDYAAQDLWSLGAIVSEIASFDIGGSDRVAECRARRTKDGALQTMHFFQKDPPHPLKTSVSKEHEELLILPRSNAAGHSETIVSKLWTDQFYQQQLFTTIESLFCAQDTPTKPIRGAVEFVQSLESQIQEANRVSERDAWKDTENMTLVPQKWRSETPNKDHILYAHVQEELPPRESDTPYIPDSSIIRCGIWLSPLPYQKLRIRLFWYTQDGEPRSDELSVSRDDKTLGVRPEYARSDLKDLNQLVHTSSGITITPCSIRGFGARVMYPYHPHKFPSLLDAFRFQSLMTGMEICDNMTLITNSFFIGWRTLKPISNFYREGFEKSPMDKFDGHVQIWKSHTEGKVFIAMLECVRGFSPNTEIQVSVVPVDNSFWRRMDHEFDSKGLYLFDIEVCKFHVANGIPLSITFPVPDSFDGKVVTKSKHKLVFLGLKSEGQAEAIERFWRTLNRTLRPTSTDSRSESDSAVVPLSLPAPHALPSGIMMRLEANVRRFSTNPRMSVPMLFPRRRVDGNETTLPNQASGISLFPKKP